MREIVCKPLAQESFRRYGAYANLLEPNGDKLSPGAVEFYRDLLPLPLAGAVTASVTQIDPRPLVVDKWEYHTATGEAFLPLDGDVVACVLPAGRAQEPDTSLAEAFLIPRGTMVTLRAGVWHQAPYAMGDKRVHNLVLLPERTYANDCAVVAPPENERLRLVLE